MGLFDFLKKKDKTDVEQYQQGLNARRAAPVAEERPTPSGSGTILFKVDDVFAITGQGTVVTGQCRAPFSVGDAVCVCNRDGSCHETVVTGIEFRKTFTHAEPGGNLGVLLQGLSKADIICGALLKAR